VRQLQHAFAELEKFRGHSSADADEETTGAGYVPQPLLLGRVLVPADLQVRDPVRSTPSSRPPFHRTLTRRAAALLTVGPCQLGAYINACQ
jgi:hypothetical protein